MYRVVTTYRNGTARPIIEHGPWHPSRQHTEYWAEQLRVAGYIVEIQTQAGKSNDDDNSELASALASMA